jgi:deazaflavin-dependent oxidoreductase (nitroreductase family)
MDLVFRNSVHPFVSLSSPSVVSPVFSYRQSAMIVAAWVISLLTILLAPILLIRFRKRWVAAFNLAVTNRITSRFADRLPGFGILTHVGRKSGRLYHTPVNVFRAPDGFLIALTYGRESEWVKNVLAAGGCELETRGVRYLLSAPTILHDPTRRRFPLPVRMMLGIIGANDFMQLRTSYAIRGVASKSVRNIRLR